MGNNVTLPEGAPLVTTENVLHNANDGDIILFAGKGNDSVLIRALGRESMWSHIGVVFVNDDGDKFLFESVNGTFPRDCLTGQYKDGVRLSDLKERLYHYNGFFYAIRKLVIPDRIRKDKRFRNRFIDFIHKASSAPYTKFMEELFLSVDSSNVYQTQDFFCVQLVAELFMQLGFFTRERNSNNYRLKDFSTFEIEESGLDWNTNILHKGEQMGFGREVFVKCTNKRRFYLI
jgi:hypothetical protein